MHITKITINRLTFGGSALPVIVLYTTAKTEGARWPAQSH